MFGYKVVKLRARCVDQVSVIQFSEMLVLIIYCTDTRNLNGILYIYFACIYEVDLGFWSKVRMPHLGLKFYHDVIVYILES